MKNHHHNAPPIPSTKSVIHEAIASRAHELWIEYGQPENRADEIWLEAECELVTGKRRAQAGATLPVSF